MNTETQSELAKKQSKMSPFDPAYAWGSPMTIDQSLEYRKVMRHVDSAGERALMLRFGGAKPDTEEKRRVFDSARRKALSEALDAHWERWAASYGADYLPKDISLERLCLARSRKNKEKCRHLLPGLYGVFR